MAEPCQLTNVQSTRGLGWIIFADAIPGCHSLVHCCFLEPCQTVLAHVCAIIVDNFVKGLTGCLALIALQALFLGEYL